MSILSEDNPITKEYLIEKYNMKPYYYDDVGESDMYCTEVCLCGPFGKIFSAYYQLIYDFNSNRVRVVFLDWYKILGGESEITMIYNDITNESDIDLLIDKYNEDIYKVTDNVANKDQYVIKYNYNKLNRFMQGYKW